ncbi:hypothetical protein EBR96_04285, partial [bacterium]|nr:hypothetical protein [bacterium]
MAKIPASPVSPVVAQRQVAALRTTSAKTPAIQAARPAVKSATHTAPTNFRALAATRNPFELLQDESPVRESASRSARRRHRGHHGEASAETRPTVVATAPVLPVAKTAVAEAASADPAPSAPGHDDDH